MTNPLPPGKVVYILYEAREGWNFPLAIHGIYATNEQAERARDDYMRGHTTIPHIKPWILNRSYWPGMVE